MADYSRAASSERFRFEGVRTTGTPDSLPVHKHPYALNVRGYGESTINSRPQIAQSQAAPGGGNNGAVLSLEPTNGVYKIGSKLLSAGTVIDTGYSSGTGCSIAPFRPNASPNPWDYVFDDNKASKVYVPASGSPVVLKAGIAEPQTSPEACPDQYNVYAINGVAGNYAATGTAGALSDQVRDADTAVAFFADPASVSPSISTRYSMQVGTAQYQTGQEITVAKSSGGMVPMIVQDVLPAVNIQASLSIQAIYYFSGTTGRCVIVPSQMPISSVAPQFQGDQPNVNIQAQQLIAALRRGSLIRIGTGGTQETVFVLSVTLGPTSSTAFECVTVNNHAASEVLVGIPALTVSFVENPALLTGQAIAAVSIQSVIAVGTGNIDIAIAAANNPFVNQPFTPDPTLPTAQEDDYVHISFRASDITLLAEIRLIFDINNGAADFASNAMYFAVRPSDFAAAVAGTQSQFAAAQLATQRALITQRIALNMPVVANEPASSPEEGSGLVSAGGIQFTPIDSGLAGNDTGNFSNIDPGAQTETGTSQWTEIMFPISSLTRIGNDETRTLANCQAMRIEVTVTNNLTLQFSSPWVGAGGQPDTGESVLGYFYRERPRNSLTGAVGNPSPATRYAVFPRRQRVIVTPVSASYDSQYDTRDFFRFGGQLTSWRYVGSILVSGGNFPDNVFDSAIVQNQLLEFSNFEPFPSIGPPITASSATIIGTAMTAVFPSATASPAAAGTLSQLGKLLPGNLFNVGQQVFTLYNRPTLITSDPATQTYLFRFVESAGKQTNPLVLCQEPNLAAQGTNNVWGPDASGKFFAVQAGASAASFGLRPGLIQWTNANNPDGASDANTKDLCPPSEPLQNGALAAGTSIVFSPNRAWRGYPQRDGSYSWVEAPVGRGLAAEFGICTDGEAIYFVAKDGICKTSGGNAQSLTDDDLYNLFPHEGIFPQDVTYAGQTIYAPEYKYAANFRLNVANGYLYFDYLDTNQNQRTLVCDLRRVAWVPDSYPNPVTIHVGVTSPASNQLVPALAIRNQQLYLGDTTGAIYTESAANPLGEIVSCVVATREEMLGDLRANKIFGDASLDALAAGSNLTATPVFLGTVFGTATTIIGSQAKRPDSPYTINLLGGQIKRSMGLLLSWTDQGTVSQLVSWQPSYIPQPEDISIRFTDWDDAGTPDNKFWQGFEIELDSLNVIKTLKVRDADSLGLHDFSSNIGLNQVQANGQQVIACSFSTPFRAHLVRIEPQDSNIWRLFKIRWFVEPTPEFALTWATQHTSHGMKGYQHVKQIFFAYSSPAAVTFTLTVDATAYTLNLPSTSGYQKVLMTFPANKGLVFQYAATSTQPFAVWVEDIELLVKQWGASGSYENVKLIGGSMGNAARI